MTPILLTPTDLIIAESLIVVDGALSLLLGLHLHRVLPAATIRALLVVGH